MHKVMKYFQKRGEQQRAIRELSNFTDRELEDIGISRWDIRKTVKNGQ